MHIPSILPLSLSLSLSLITLPLVSSYGITLSKTPGGSKICHSYPLNQCCDSSFIENGTIAYEGYSTVVFTGLNNGDTVYAYNAGGCGTEFRTMVARVPTVTFTATGGHPTLTGGMVKRTHREGLGRMASSERQEVVGDDVGVRDADGLEGKLSPTAVMGMMAEGKHHDL